MLYSFIDSAIPVRYSTNLPLRDIWMWGWQYHEVNVANRPPTNECGVWLRAGNGGRGIAESNPFVDPTCLRLCREAYFAPQAFAHMSTSHHLAA